MKISCLFPSTSTNITIIPLTLTLTLMNNPFPDMNTSNMSKNCFRPIQENHNHTIQSSSQDMSAAFDIDEE